MKYLSKETMFFGGFDAERWEEIFGRRQDEPRRDTEGQLLNEEKDGKTK